MEQLPKIVRQRLQAAVPPDVHPDANLLAAFAEHDLSGEEHERVTEHLAQCAECRDVVSLAVPEMELVAAAAAVPAMPAAMVAARHVSWFRRPVFRWAGAAAVVIIGAVVLTRDLNQKSTLTASRQTPVAVALDHQELRQDSTPAAPQAESTRTAAPESTARLLAKKKTENSLDTVMGVPDRGNTSQIAMAPPPPPPSPAAAVPGTASETVQVQADTAGASDALKDNGNQAYSAGQSIVALGAKAEDNKASTRQAEAELQSPRMQVEAKYRAAESNGLTAELVAAKWTLSSEGKLQRSFDNGRHWLLVTALKDQTFSTFCVDEQSIWAGGTGGSLYHSADSGETWAQVKPTAGSETLTADIKRVEFSDLHGTVTAAKHQVWTTQDGGKTWQKQ